MPDRLRPGDRVALLVPGGPSYVDLVILATRQGVVPVPLDPRLTEREQAAILADVDPAVVVRSAGELAALAARLDPDPASPVPLVRPMHMTSGTTGTPKGVWSGVLADAAARALVEEERELWGFTASDVHLVLSPLYHSAPLRFAVGTILAGGRIVVPGPFDPAAATRAIVEERPTTVFCVPAHLQRLFAHWDEVGAPDLSCFRLLAHAGAACPPPVKQRLIGLFPAGTTWEFYGSTEGQFTACRSEEWLEHPGTVGRARPGRTLAVEADGTIWCTVPEHARFTYWNAPEKTAATWRDTPEGPAFTVGDLGRLDEDGYLYLEGRREDLVISGGVNVYPVEVEHVLAEHPLVTDVAVFGVDDDRWGQRVCAAVVGSASAEELTAWVAERLAPPKRPKEYFPVQALPHTATGKIKRLELPGLLGLL
ncbi:MAG TPA: AMP-binding protein [Nocardioidaceae bacterium]|nr:AMP-binding protein [Nocardioidaceae bacterium]